MIKTNRTQLVCQSVIGEITSPLSGVNPYRVSPYGVPGIYPGVGGITYNLKIGDKACGWFADHVEPGVSLSNFAKFNGQDGPNRALNQFSCAGNTAMIVSGEAKGEKGRVTGKHGGIEHVLLDFPKKTLEKLVIGDKIQVKAFGCGLKFTDYPSIKLINLDPGLVEAIPWKQIKKKQIEVPVTHIIPSKIMGSGIGLPHSQSGDYDIQLFDEEIVKEYGLDTLKLGDFVAIIDADATFGRIYKTGGVVIGVVVHSDCVLAGHGPGAMVVMSSKDGSIVPVIRKQANLKQYFKKMK